MTKDLELLQQSYANQQAKGWRTIVPLFYGLLASTVMLNTGNYRNLVSMTPLGASAAYVAVTAKRQRDLTNRALNDSEWVLAQLSKDRECKEMLIQLGFVGGSSRPVSPGKQQSINEGRTSKTLGGLQSKQPETVKSPSFR
jgi:hypothetical protein